MLSNRWRICLIAGGFLGWNLVIADPSYGCSDTLPKPVEWDAKPGEVKMFRVNDRPVRVTVPESYNKTKPAPMIIAFHDKDQPPEHLEYDGQWTDPKVNKDVIMVYPTAENVRIPNSYLYMQIKTNSIRTDGCRISALERKRIRNQPPKHPIVPPTFNSLIFLLKTWRISCALTRVEYTQWVWALVEV